MLLALIGTTLSCMNTGARITYAMGKDQEAPSQLGLLHPKNLTPHRAIWTLAVISAIFGCLAVCMVFGDAGAIPDATIQALPHGFWSSFGYTTHDKMAALPNSLLTITLASNFGTFVLYALSCALCMVAYHKHPNFNFVRHLAIPMFGLLANLACMIVLSRRPGDGLRHHARTFAGSGDCRGMGFVWRSVFLPRQQEDGAEDFD